MLFRKVGVEGLEEVLAPSKEVHEQIDKRRKSDFGGQDQIIKMLVILTGKQDEVLTLNKKVLFSIESLSVVVKQGFAGVGDVLEKLTAKACLGSSECKEAIEQLHVSLVQQKAAGELSADAIHRSLASLGGSFSADVAALRESMTSVVESSSQKDAGQKLDLLLSMVSGMRDDISSIKRSVDTIADLAVHLDQTQRFPSTFIIKPSPKTPPTDANAGRFAKVTNFIQRRMKEPAMELLWKKSTLCFICPVSLMEVDCGPEGKGYAIEVPTETLKTIAPALRFGLLALKIGLATQGAGALLPNVDGLLPGFAGDYLNSLNSYIVDAAGGSMDDSLSSVDDYLASASSAADDADAAAALKAIEVFVRQGEGASETDSNWESRLSGLCKTVSEDGQICWVSKEAVEDFKKKGKSALVRKMK